MMTYYSRDNCVSAGESSGCSTDYELSDIKQVIDVWKNNYVSESIEVKLISTDILVENLGYEYKENVTSSWYERTENTPNWVYNISYSYWTMDQYENQAYKVWNVMQNGDVHDGYVAGDEVIRPVVTISKSVLN